MFRQKYVNLSASLVAAIVLACVGCETLHNAGVPGLQMYVKPDPAKLEEERAHREKFSNSQDHESLYWLVANRLQTTMTLREVEAAIGETGEPTNETGHLRPEGIQLTDTAYMWGPDSDGYTVILFFRDGRLTNFHPDDYDLPSSRTRRSSKKRTVSKDPNELTQDPNAAADPTLSTSF